MGDVVDAIATPFEVVDPYLGSGPRRDRRAAHADPGGLGPLRARRRRRGLAAQPARDALGGHRRSRSWSSPTASSAWSTASPTLIARHRRSSPRTRASRSRTSPTPARCSRLDPSEVDAPREVHSVVLDDGEADPRAGPARQHPANEGRTAPCAGRATTSAGPSRTPGRARTRRPTRTAPAPATTKENVASKTKGITGSRAGLLAAVPRPTPTSSWTC